TLALFVAQSMLESAIRYLGSRDGMAARLKIALGSRDNPPPASALCRRAARAFNNLQEAMPVFLALALLSLHHGKAADAELGAHIFLACRCLYVPVYLAGVPGLRSAVWLGSWVGLGQMIAALV